MAPAPSSAEAILAAAGATERSGDSLNSDNCRLFPYRFDGHGASLSVNFGSSSNSVSTTSLRPNNEIPISPRTKRTVPATMSQCGYARNKAKAFVIFASFCLKTTGGGVYGPLPARHDNPLKVLAFPALATAFAFLQGFGAGNVGRRRLRFTLAVLSPRIQRPRPRGRFSANQPPQHRHSQRL